MSFAKVTDFLSIVTRKYGLERQASACLVCNRARKVILEKYSEFSKDWIPTKFEDGVLFVSVSNSASSSELFLETHNMLEVFLESNLENVRDLRIVRTR